MIRQIAVMSRPDPTMKQAMKNSMFIVILWAYCYGQVPIGYQLARGEHLRISCIASFHFRFDYISVGRLDIAA